MWLTYRTSRRLRNMAERGCPPNVARERRSSFRARMRLGFRNERGIASTSKSKRTLETPVASIELRKLAKVYPGRIDALRPMDVSVPSGELLVLLGPSGSGKSTILRLIAGLERPSSGSVYIE